MAGEQSIAELILRIVADASDIKKALQEASDATGKFAKETGTQAAQADSVLGSLLKAQEEKAKKTTSSFASLGSGMRQVSRNLTQFSAIVMGPVVTALAVASKQNYNVSYAMKTLGIATQSFSNEIAKAALPMVEKFTDWMFKLTEWFQKLPAEVKRNIVETALWVGGIAAGGAVVTRLIFLLSKLPVLFWQVAAVGTVAFGAWKLGRWISDVTGLDEALSGPNGLFTKMFTWLDKVIPKLIEFGAGVAKLTTDTMGLSGLIGAGAASPTDAGETDLKVVNLEKIVVKTTQAAQSALKLKAAWGETAKGFNSGLIQMANKLGSWGSMVENFTVGIATAMTTAFSEFFFDLFSGELKSAEEYIASFGKAIVQMIANLIAQLIAMWLIVQLLEMTPAGRAVVNMLGWQAMAGRHEGGVVKHEGGYIKKAHEGLSNGEVPIIAQSGEGILSRNGMASLGEEGLNKINQGNGSIGSSPIYLIQNISSWDSVDVIRNKKVLATGMIEELMNNGAFRSAILKYTR